MVTRMDGWMTRARAERFDGTARRARVERTNARARARDARARRARARRRATTTTTTTTTDAGRARDEDGRRAERRARRRARRQAREPKDLERGRRVRGGRARRAGDVEADARARGRGDAADAEASAARLLVWFHGYGDVDGGSWREFCEVVARARGSAGGRTAIATPDAMRMDAGNGRFPRAWFKPRLRVRRKDEREWTCDGIEDAVVRAVTIVDDAVRKYGIQRKDVVLGGFSQGACLALACAKSELSDVGGVLAVRGYLPNRSREFSELKPDTLILAGGADPLVPVEWSLEAGRLTGGMVTLRENMGHELCVEDVYRARRWFHERAVANGNCYRESHRTRGLA